MIGGLIACTQQSKPMVTEQYGDHETKEDPPTESAVPGEKVYENEAFKEVAVTQSDDEVTVTGKARVFEGVFQYALYAGDKEVETSNYQTDGAPVWGEFTIAFKNTFVTSVELFHYSAKDGLKVDSLDIPISMNR